MKSVLDPSFVYTPSFETDVRKTFARIRREQQARLQENEKQSSRAGPSAAEGAERGARVRVAPASTAGPVAAPSLAS